VHSLGAYCRSEERVASLIKAEVSRVSPSDSLQWAINVHTSSTLMDTWPNVALG
jgi:hypothetical protein